MRGRRNRKRPASEIAVTFNWVESRFSVFRISGKVPPRMAMSEDSDSKAPRRTKLPEKKKPTPVPVARKVAPPKEAVQAAEAVPPVGSHRRQPIPPEPGKKLNLKRIILASLLPLAGLAAIVLIVRALDSPKAGPEEVEGGTLFWMADGIVAVQEDPESEKRMYYVVEAPREADPNVAFDENEMTLRVNTDEGRQTIVHNADWTKAPTVMFYTFKDYFQTPLELEGDTEFIDRYLMAAGPGAPLRGFLARFRPAEIVAPGDEDSEPGLLLEIPPVQP